MTDDQEPQSSGVPDTSNYSTPPQWLPSSEEEENISLEVYKAHAISRQPMREIAKRLGIPERRVYQMVKWAAFYYDEQGDMQVYKQTLDTQLDAHIAMLNGLMQPTKVQVPQEEGPPQEMEMPVKMSDKVKIAAEIRRTMQLQAKVRSVIDGEGSKDTKVQIIIPNLNRRQGVASLGPDDIVEAIVEANGRSQS